MFKPTGGKKIILWISMTMVGMFVWILLLLLAGSNVMELLAVVFVGMLVLGGNFLILLNRADLRIELKGNSVEGPSLYSIGWRRVNFTCAELDMEKTGRKLSFLGFYVLHARCGEKICTWGFDKALFEKLTAAIEERKRNPVEEDPFARVQQLIL